MGDQQQFDFLDILTMISTALQFQEHIIGVTRRDIMVLNAKLDRLLQLAEDNSKGVDKRL